MSGIAYYVGGYLSALLDGHHRATASLLEGKPLLCLTIARVDSVSFEKSNQLKALFMGGQTIDATMIPKSIRKNIQKQFEDRGHALLESSATDKLVRWKTYYKL